MTLRISAKDHQQAGQKLLVEATHDALYPLVLAGKPGRRRNQPRGWVRQPKRRSPGGLLLPLAPSATIQPPKPAPVILAPKAPRLKQESTRRIHFACRGFKILAQRPVAFGHQGAKLRHVPGLQGVSACRHAGSSPSPRGARALGFFPAERADLVERRRAQAGHAQCPLLRPRTGCAARYMRRRSAAATGLNAGSQSCASWAAGRAWFQASSCQRTAPNPACPSRTPSGPSSHSSRRRSCFPSSAPTVRQFLRRDLDAKSLHRRPQRRDLQRG